MCKYLTSVNGKRSQQVIFRSSQSNFFAPSFDDSGALTGGRRPLQDTLFDAHPPTRRHHSGVIELDGNYRILTASPGHHPAPTFTPLSCRSPSQAVRGEPLASPEAITDLKSGRRCEFCGRFFFCPAALHTLDHHTAVAGGDLKALVSRRDDGAGRSIWINGFTKAGIKYPQPLTVVGRACAGLGVATSYQVIDLSGGQGPVDSAVFRLRPALVSRSRIVLDYFGAFPSRTRSIDSIIASTPIGYRWLK